jgi:hypothetical protein
MAFAELSSARGSNGNGPNPISYTEIAAWAQLTGRTLTPWLVATLVAMDRAWLAARADVVALDN